MGNLSYKQQQEAKDDIKKTFAPSDVGGDISRGVSSAWDTVKGLVGGGEDKSAMGTVLQNRAKKLQSDD